MKVKNLLLSRVIFALFIATAFLTAQAEAESLGDPFDGDQFQNPNWKWSKESKQWDVGKTEAGWLHMTGETNHNLWTNDDPSRVYQEHTGDFDVETHLLMDYEPSSVVAGLVALSPTTKDHNGRDGEWVTIKLWGRGAAQGSNAVIQYQKREFDNGEGLVATVPNFQEPAGEMDLYLRLRREKDTFTAWWKPEKNDAWIEIGVTDQKFDEPLQVGVYAGVADGAGEMVAQYEYFEDLIEPFAVSPRAKLPLTWGALKQRAGVIRQNE